MKVRLGTIELSDEMRRKLNVYDGKKGLAKRKDVLAHIHNTLRKHLEGVRWYVDQWEKRNFGRKENEI